MTEDNRRELTEAEMLEELEEMGLTAEHAEIFYGRKLTKGD